MASPTKSPDLSPLRCRDFTAWPVGGGRFVGAYLADDGNWEVLHVGHRFELRPTEGGVHVHREDAEKAAADLYKLISSWNAS